MDVRTCFRPIGQEQVRAATCRDYVCADIAQGPHVQPICKKKKGATRVYRDSPKPKARTRRSLTNIWVVRNRCKMWVFCGRGVTSP